MKSRVIIITLVLLMSTVLIRMYCVCGGTSLFQRKPPRHVILLTVDTLRRDHLGGYGNPEVYTPNLDHLVKNSLQFQMAVAPIARTNPSFATLHTGKDPLDHGVDSLFKILAEQEITLAEELKKQSFKTVFFNANPMLAPQSGFSQGFHTYVEPVKQAKQEDHSSRFPKVIQEKRESNKTNKVISEKKKEKVGWLTKINETGYDLSDTEPNEKHAAEYVTNDAIDYIDNLKPSDRAFMWLLYMDPHWPYEPPSPYNQMHLDSFHSNFDDFSMMPMPEIKFHNTMNKNTRDYLRSLYMSEVDYTDYHIGRLLKHLESKKMLEDTLIVFVADHGESMGEHGVYFCHGDVVYNDNIQVPFCVNWKQNLSPGLSSWRVPMSEIKEILMDIYDTAKVNHDYLTESVSPRVFIMTGKTSIDNPRNKYKKTEFRQHGLIEDHYKLIQIPLLNSEQWEMYDLAEDPQERVNIWNTSNSKLVKIRTRMTTALERWIKKRNDNDNSEKLRNPVDPSELEQLKQLGYLDSL